MGRRAKIPRPSTMSDLNHILLFVAFASPVILLLRGWRRGALERSWRLASITVLLLTGATWIVLPARAGFVGGGAWLFLLLVPAVTLRKVADLALQERFATARRFARLTRIVHSTIELRERTRTLHALALAQNGLTNAALALLAPLRGNETPSRRQASAESFRIRGDWEGLVAWFRDELPPAIAQTDSLLLPLYLRALGETGRLDDLVRQFAARADVLAESPQQNSIFHACLIPVLAFCGRTASLTKLLGKKFCRLPNDSRRFWIAMGERAATRAILSPASEFFLTRFEQEEKKTRGIFATQAARPTTGVAILICVNLAMFLVEIAQGGSTNPETLHRLGWLEPGALRYTHEYWRLVTALFLHFGPLHLFFNLYALFVIGPGLERALGATLFVISYLLAGLGSSAGVVLLHAFRLTGAEQLVGASGCVMGLVGVWAGLLLRHRHLPHARLRLRNIFVIIAIQTAFDLSTPQISMGAHWSGLITGFVLGLLFAEREVTGDGRA